MPIDLPPLPPPDLSTVGELKARGSNAVELSIAGYEAKISGTSLLTSDEVKKALEPATDLSQAVRALNALYRLKGYIAVKILYVLDGQTLLIYANEGCIAGIDAPPRLQGYLDDLVGDCALTAARFSKEKTLADLLVDRAGQSVTPDLRFDPNGKDVTIVLDGVPIEDHDRTDWSLSFGNPGNRFLGRYFGGAGVRHHTRRGTELTATYTRALTSIGSSPRGGKRLDAYQLGAGIVHPWGLFSMSGSLVDYEQEVAGIDLEASIGQYELAGQHLLPSPATGRWVVSEKILYVDSEITAPQFNADVQDESYPALELGTVYTQAFNFMNQALSAQVSLVLRHGLGDQDGTFEISGRRGDFFLGEPGLQLRWELPAKHRLQWTTNAQITSDSLPEQQQWVLGGINTLSAWLPGVLVGDSGYHSILQFSFAPWQLVSERPLNFSLFAEVGSSKFEGLPAPLDQRFTLGDAGLRLEFEILEGLTLDAVAAVPIKDSDNDLVDDFLDDLRSDAFFNLRKVW